MVSLANPLVLALVEQEHTKSLVVGEQRYSLRFVDESQCACVFRALRRGTSSPAAYYIKTVFRDDGAYACESERAASELENETANHRRFLSERPADAAKLLDADDAFVKAVRERLGISERWPVQVSEEPTGYVTLEVMTQSLPSFYERSRLASDLLRFMKGFNTVGSHCDMHNRNILVLKAPGEAEDDGTLYSFKLIDFDRFLWNDGGEPDPFIGNVYDRFAALFGARGLPAPGLHKYARALDVSMAFFPLHREAAAVLGVDGPAIDRVRDAFILDASRLLERHAANADMTMRMWGHAWASLWLEAHGGDPDRSIEHLAQGAKRQRGQ